MWCACPNLRACFTPAAAGRHRLQLFACYMQPSLRGCDVDKPRNLAKSVTVE